MNACNLDYNTEKNRFLEHLNNTKLKEHTMSSVDYPSDEKMDIKIHSCLLGRSLAPVLHASRLHADANTYAYHSVAR